MDILVYLRTATNLGRQAVRGAQAGAHRAASAAPCAGPGAAAVVDPAAAGAAARHAAAAAVGFAAGSAELAQAAAFVRLGRAAGAVAAQHWSSLPPDHCPAHTRAKPAARRCLPGLDVAKKTLLLKAVE